VLLGLELVQAKSLDSLGLGGGSGLALPQLLDVAKKIVLDGRKGHGAKGVEDGGQGLGRIEELGGGNGIVLLGINRDIDERLLEGVEQSTTGRESRGRHVVVGGGDVEMWWVGGLCKWRRRESWEQAGPAERWYLKLEVEEEDMDTGDP
jgi:hypothetical protein